jgi:hypothetical protein
MNFFISLAVGKTAKIFNFCQPGLGQERSNKCQESESSNGIFVIQGETCSQQDRTDAKMAKLSFWGSRRNLLYISSTLSIFALDEISS